MNFLLVMVLCLYMTSCLTEKDTFQADISESKASENTGIELEPSEQEPILPTALENASDLIIPMGSGTEQNPYVIDSIAHLLWLAEQDDTSKNTFLLSQDIDMPVAVDFIISSFSGVFDGNGNSITLDIYSEEDGVNVGLFGKIGKQGVVKNLNVTGSVTVSGNAQIVGGIVGFNEGIVENSSSFVDIVSISAEQLQSGFLGGIAGHNADTGIIIGSYASGSVSRSDDEAQETQGVVDGLIGPPYDTGVGGLVGGNFGTIENCFATGSVDDRPENGSYTGGLVGINWGTIRSSYATGNVSGNIVVGGLAGANYGAIQDGFATGNVMAAFNVGGLIGNSNGEVLRTFATGDVTSTASATHHGSNAGGLIGLDSREEALSIDRSVAFNGNISAFDELAIPSRIVGLAWRWTEESKVSNRAYVGMKIDRKLFNGDGSDANSADGQDVTFAELMDRNFWIHTMGWSERIWSFESDKLPTLKNVQVNLD
jgi:hypothetical protein